MQQLNQQQNRTRINQFIRVPQVRVILSDGSNGGVMDTHLALKMARDENLDLIEINPKALPPVCRIASIGKIRYEEKKQQQLAKKNQQVQEVKEIVFRPATDLNDMNHKIAKAKEFLAENHRVKLAVKFKGREISHSDIGREKLNWVLERLADIIAPNPQINLEGKLMSALISPSKNKP
jgi:translation initiation factor IF-3